MILLSSARVPAGLTAAEFAARLGAKVALVEKERIGGDCTWTGCIPSKALLKVAKVAHQVRTASDYGVNTEHPLIDMVKVRAYVRQAIEDIYRHETPDRLAEQGIEVVLGAACFLNAHTLQVGEQALSAKKFIIAAGARPFIPPVSGLSAVPYLTYDQIFENDHRPERLIVMGAGPIGVEIAQAYQRLGAQVTLIDVGLLPREEPEVAQVMSRVFAREGLQFVKGLVTTVRQKDAEIILSVKEQQFRGEMLLVAVGRAPTVAGLNLEQAGVIYSPKGIPVDSKLRTNIRHIYAVGDCIQDNLQFTHLAAWQGFQAVRNALLPGSSRGFSQIVPWTTFTDPEVARVITVSFLLFPQFYCSMFFPMKRFSRIQTKLIVTFLLVVLLPLHGTAFYGNWVTSRVLEEVALNSTRHQLELLASNISSDLAGLGHEALYLSRLDSLANLLTGLSRANKAAAVEARNRLAQDFLVYAQNHPFIYQVRYLNEAGQEVVRIDCEAGNCRPRAADQLQNKAARYYFTETMRLSAGQLYVSPLDLNQEFGQIEHPYRPVIRLATPVFFKDDPANSSHRRAGIVIINILAEPILARIEQANAAAQQIALADAGGYYLAHPDAGRRWGGPDNLNTSQGLQRDYGPLADRFFQSDSGDFYYPEQAGWQQLAAQLLPPAPFIARQRAILFQRISPFGPTGPAWLLISNQPRAALSAPINNFRWTALIILSLTTLAAMGMVVLLARRLTDPISTLIHGARRIEAGEWGHRIKIDSPDEIGDLAVAFNAMAATQQHNLEQLSALHQAGRHIASRLEQEEVLQAAFLAVQKMFPVTYSCITLTRGNLSRPLAQVEWGDQTWANHRQMIEHQSVLRNCLIDFEWRTGALALTSGPEGYFCCAPLCMGKDFVGLLEIYGTDPALASQSTGNMLAALAAQVSIALENAWLYRQLKEHRAQLQDLVEQLISAQEEERRVLAYDIHDGLIQRLVGTRLHLTNGMAELNDAEIDSLNKGLAQLGAAITEARTIIEGLRPALLDDLGLVEALRQHVQMIAAQTQWQVSFQASPESMQLPDWIEITAFRIAQEALNNIVKHAKAQRVAVTLVLEDDLLHITVRDWGGGFDPQAGSHHRRQVGLTSMRERARLVGGEFTLESALGLGTLVSVVLPLKTPLEFEPATPPVKEPLMKQPVSHAPDETKQQGSRGVEEQGSMGVWENC